MGHSTDPASAVRGAIETAAREHGLAFRPDRYRFLRLAPEEQVLADYLLGCPTEPYSNYGMETAERVRRLPEFLGSGDVARQAGAKPSTGSVVDCAELEPAMAFVRELPDAARQAVEALRDKLRAARTPGSEAAILLSWREGEDPARVAGVLLHEWCHVLAFDNGLKFQAIAPDLWLLDEGIATLWEYAFRFPEDPAGALRRTLANCHERGLPPSATGYYENALRFRDLLAPCETPEARRAVLFNELGECRERTVNSIA